jgi:hypothetical protein
MMQEQIRNSELDSLIKSVLKSDEGLIIPSGLSERTFRRLEKRILLRELMLELVFKIGLVSGSLAILAGVFVWINGIGVLTGLYAQFLDNWQIVTSLLLLVFVTILIDQVGLRFYSIFKKEVSLKEW